MGCVIELWTVLIVLPALLLDLCFWRVRASNVLEGRTGLLSERSNPTPEFWFWGWWWTLMIFLTVNIFIGLICTFISPSADPVTNMVSLLSMAIHFTLNFCLVEGNEFFVYIGSNYNEKPLSLNIFGSTTLPHAHGRGMCGAVSLALSPRGTPMCLMISKRVM